MKCITLPIVGLPNVGKSTLMNMLVGEKISAVSHKKHTTRMIQFGAKTVNDVQVLLVDTPGFENVKTKLGGMVFSSMKKYLEEAEEMLLVLDAAYPSLEKMGQYVSKSVVVLNKIDLLRKPKLLTLIAELRDLGAKEIFMISARTGDGVDELFDYLTTHNNFIDIEEEQQVDDLRHFVCECVREKIFERCDQEIPYKVWIEPEVFTVPPSSAWEIHLRIVVPKDTYRPILLGKKGEMIKSIGIAARMEISSRLRQPGHLGLKIVVDEKLWKKDDVYKRLGWLD